LDHVGDGQVGCLRGQAPRLAIGIRGEVTQKGGVVVDAGIGYGIHAIWKPRCIAGRQWTSAIDDGLGLLDVLVGPSKKAAAHFCQLTVHSRLLGKVTAKHL
jgi:hypothetical protein